MKFVYFSLMTQCSPGCGDIIPDETRCFRKNRLDFVFFFVVIILFGRYFSGSERISAEIGRKSPLTEGRGVVE